MSFRAFFLTLLLISVVIAKDSFGCTFCNALVENTQTLVGKSEQEILSILDTVSEPLCSELTDELSPSQCKSAIQIYGPFVVELLASGMKNSEVCGHIGLCEDSEKYTIMWPSIGKDEITYSTKNHLPKTQPLSYKIFLGDFSSLNEETYALFTTLKGFTGTSVSVQLTNGADFVETSSCKEGEQCLIQTSKPGRRVWCFITLQSNDAETDFELEIVEKNSQTIVPVRIQKNHIHLITFVVLVTLMMTCIFCFALTKCIFKKKRQQLTSGNFMMDELIEHPPMMMFIPFEGGYIPAYAPVPVAQL